MDQNKAQSIIEKLKSTRQCLESENSLMSTLAFRVPQILLNNLSWTQNKSCSIYYGEESAKSWNPFGFVLMVNYEFFLIIVVMLTNQS